ncbi:hypothetical protein BGW41_006155, partial [Actinomortierella wolfii]
MMLEELSGRQGRQNAQQEWEVLDEWLSWRKETLTATIGGMVFSQAVNDPGCDQTMLGVHVAEELGLQLVPHKGDVMKADG